MCGSTIPTHCTHVLEPIWLLIVPTCYPSALTCLPPCCIVSTILFLTTKDKHTQTHTHSLLHICQHIKHVPLEALLSHVQMGGGGAPTQPFVCRPRCRATSPDNGAVESEFALTHLAVSGLRFSGCAPRGDVNGASHAAVVLCKYPRAEKCLFVRVL